MSDEVDHNKLSSDGEDGDVHLEELINQEPNQDLVVKLNDSVNSKEIQAENKENKNKTKDHDQPVGPSRKRKWSRENYDSVDLPVMKTEHSKRRVPGKIIDKLWAPLDPNSLKSLDKIFLISLNKTLEKYNLSNSNRLSKKMTEAQNIITREWLNEDDSSSFKSRLKASKVPLPSSVFNNPKNTPKIDIFSFDQLRRRKISLETYLLAELKQLSSLEKLYCNLEMIFELDSAYLEEFKKTTAINISRMKEEIDNKKKSLGFDDTKGEQEDMIPNTLKSFKLFIPSKDKDIQTLQNKLNDKLSNINDPTLGPAKLVDRINKLYSILEML